MSETLIEQVVSAARERIRGQIRAAPAWHDLDAAGRIEAFEQTRISRSLEAALDDDGLSTTGHRVLELIHRG